MDKRLIGPIYGNVQINSKNQPIECQRDLLALYAKPLKARIRKANDRMIRYAAARHATNTSLMRHCLFLSLAPSPLTRGVPKRSATAVLVARLRAAHRLASANARALPDAIDVAVITAMADAYLRLTTLAVVQPIRRLAQMLQRPSPSAGQQPSGQA
jgi:hypothetical protein